MYTIAILTRRPAGMTPEEAFEHYTKIHYGLVSKMPGLVSYQQAGARHTPPGSTAPDSLPDYDTLSQYTFETREDAEAAFASPQGEAVNQDTANFADWDSVLYFPVEYTQRFEKEQS